MTEDDLKKLLAKALANYHAMTPEQKAEHDQAQRDSYVRAEMGWPKSNWHMEGNTKVYHSYEDYLND